VIEIIGRKKFSTSSPESEGISPPYWLSRSSCLRALILPSTSAISLLSSSEEILSTLRSQLGLSDTFFQDPFSSSDNSSPLSPFLAISTRLLRLSLSSLYSPIYSNRSRLSAPKSSVFLESDDSPSSFSEPFVLEGEELCKGKLVNA
jgi:hypothetical protein